RCSRWRRTRPAAWSALRSRTRSNSAGLPKPSRTVHLLGALPRLWRGTSSMNLPRNSSSASSCVMAPFSFLSRATASAGTDCPSKIGRMSASASAFSGAVFSSRACMRPPLPLAERSVLYVPNEPGALGGPLPSLSFLEAPLYLDKVGIGIAVPTQLILTARLRDAEPDPGGDRRRRDAELLRGLGDRIETLLGHQSVP